MTDNKKEAIGTIKVPRRGEWVLKQRIPVLLNELVLELNYNGQEENIKGGTIKGNFMGLFHDEHFTSPRCDPSFSLLYGVDTNTLLSWIDQYRSNPHYFHITGSYKEETVIEDDIKELFYLQSIKEKESVFYFNFILLFETKNLLYQNYSNLLKPLIKQVEPFLEGVLGELTEVLSISETEANKCNGFNSLTHNLNLLQSQYKNIISSSPEQFYSFSLENLKNTVAFFRALDKQVKLTEDLYNLSLEVYKLSNKKEFIPKRLKLYEEIVIVFDQRLVDGLAINNRNEYLEDIGDCSIN